jgi:short-subunit dehydrogenase
MAERKLAVITGASSGIGAMFARKLAARGYDLLLVARREDRLRSLAVELAETYHISSDVLAADLAVDADRDRVAERIRSAPNLGLLVNNAGFGTLGFFVDTTIESQLQMHRLHVVAAMHLMHAALENLVPRAEGGIINVSSVAAFGQTAGSVSYSATKGWMNAFTAGIYAELEVQKSPVRVQALCPGFTLSEFHDTLGMDRSRIRRRETVRDSGMAVQADRDVYEVDAGVDVAEDVVAWGAEVSEAEALKTQTKVCAT